MTMHLERGLTTLNTKKRKVKKKSDAFYVDGWREQNKFWKKHKLPEMELSERSEEHTSELQSPS